MTEQNTDFDTARYWESRLTEKFDLTGVGFRRKSVAYNKWVYRVRTELLDGLFRENKWSVENKSILDIGSGTGYFIDYWQTRKAGDITGLDIAEISINRLKDTFPEVKFYLADLSNPELELDGGYNYVTIFDVLFHIIDDIKFERVAVNLARFCKPGCKIFITDTFGKITFAGVQHCRNRSLEIYKNVFSSQGFKLVKMRPLFFTLLPPSGVRNPVIRWAGILAWEALTFVTRWNFFGNILGRILYGIDSVLRKIFNKGPGGYIVVFEYAP
ncbi:MAG: class I SAM-dependent methyltransferase [candidate division Zixibacteria bacterium]